MPVGILIALTKVCVLREAAHFGCHNSPAGTRTVWMEKRVPSSNSIHPSLFPDCGCHVSGCFSSSCCLDIATMISCTLEWWKNTPLLHQPVLSECSQEVKMGLATVTAHACSVHEQSLFLAICLGWHPGTHLYGVS